MDSESKEFLVKLLNTPSPTGFEQEIQKVIRQRMRRFSSEISVDLHGNLMVALNTKAKRRVMLAGHCDQIGLMVRYIASDGYLYVAALGGIDVGVLSGAQVIVLGKKGAIPGVIGRKPIHLASNEERDRVPKLEKVWIDIGAKNGKEAGKLVEVGDAAVFTPQITYLGSDLIVAPALDDRVGVFVVMEALKLLHRKKLAVALYAVSTVQEEVGLRGAKTACYSIDPEVGIAVDVTFASDNPGSEGPQAPVCRLGGGPVVVRGPNINPVVERGLLAAAKKAKIPVQLQPAARPLGNDANAMQINKGGVATASIGIPNRYMHTQVEVCSLKDLEASAKLLANFIESINDKVDFTPI